MNITCVKCTSVLDKARVGDVEVDLCPSCGGLWLDHGELEKIGKGNPKELEELRSALTGSRAPDPVSEAIASCPACPGQLLEVVLGPIKVDYCNKCHGVFLDKGELDAAVKSVDGSTLRQMLTLAGTVAG